MTRILQHTHSWGALLAAAGLLLCSCWDKGPDTPRPYEAGDVIISAEPHLIEDWTPTKAAPADLDETLLKDSSNGGFGVYAYYTGDDAFSSMHGAAGVVFNDRRFYWDGSAWTYEGYKEFWPTNQGQLTFFAYAPYAKWHGQIKTADESYKSPYVDYSPYVAQNLSVAELDKQQDLLWGTNGSGFPHRDVVAGDYTPEGTVDMHLRHATAKVHFEIAGSLSGETRTLTHTGSVDTLSRGTAYGLKVNSDTTSTFSNFQRLSYRDTTVGYYRYYYRDSTKTETERYEEIQYRVITLRRNATYSTSGKRYLVEYMTLKGFNKEGTVLLNNTEERRPSWTKVTAFGGTEPEYVLNGSNVLTDSLRYMSNPALVENDFGLYTGVKETFRDMMGGYFLYAIPTAANQIEVGLKYHIANVSGTVVETQDAVVIQYQTRSRERTRTWVRHSNLRNSSGGSYTWSNYDWEPGAWSPTSGHADPDDDYVRMSWSAWFDTTTGDKDWTYVSETPSGTPHVDYDDDTAPEISGRILTPFVGGSAYTVRIVIAGDRINLDVVPRRWNLEQFTFDYTSDENTPIQYLTYDSATIDRADNTTGKVWINNRRARFYFSLTDGRYAGWEARLPGDPVFVFTDEAGNKLLDAGGNPVSYISSSINPGQIYNIYVRVDPDNEDALYATHETKLRIYYVGEERTIALNLVQLSGVNEFTLVQEAQGSH